MKKSTIQIPKALLSNYKNRLGMTSSISIKKKHSFIDIAFIKGYTNKQLLKEPLYIKR
jgi:hypothetical protein